MTGAATARTRRDPTARTAIICAYAPELPMLAALVERPRRRTLNGLPFITGRMAGQPVVLLLSGMSLVNATMATTLVLERFTVARIVVAGIAGGSDPALEVGAVVIPDRWAQYSEATFARDEPGGYGPDILADPSNLPNFGMIFPHAACLQEGEGPFVRQLWFAADPDLLDIARRLDPALAHIGGAGVSGPVFVDNAAFSAYLFEAFAARAVDMETAAIAQVAQAYGVPFIGIRGLSDRAGAETGPNTAITNVDAVGAQSAAVVAAFMAALAK